jgi:hypothetical protein
MILRTAFVALIGLAGCANTPITDVDAGHTTPLDGSADADAVDGAVNNPFLGTWIYVTGMSTQACLGAPPSTFMTTGQLIITENGPASLLVTEPDACALPFTFSGNVARIVPHQSCKVASQAGGEDSYSMAMWTLTLSADQATLTETLSARDDSTSADGTTQVCLFSEAGVTLHRAP